MRRLCNINSHGICRVRHVNRSRLLRYPSKQSQSNGVCFVGLLVAVKQWTCDDVLNDDTELSCISIPTSVADVDFPCYRVTCAERPQIWSWLQRRPQERAWDMSLAGKQCCTEPLVLEVATAISARCKRPLRTTSRVISCGLLHWRRRCGRDFIVTRCKSLVWDRVENFRISALIRSDTKHYNNWNVKSKSSI
jgi:hypothetical protein